MLSYSAPLSLRRALLAGCVGALVVGPSASAQSDTTPTLLQVEVGDSIGLPLPEATVELFTILEGGIVWEWVRVEPSILPAGMSLLRFSHPGYRPAVFSVPLRKGGKVSLRVRLDPQGDTTAQRDAVTAYPVRAIGLALDGRAKTDIIGVRRVLAPPALASAADVPTMGAFLRRAENTDLIVTPASGGTFRVFTRGRGGGTGCAAQVMVNGDRRRIFPFATYDDLFGTGNVEAIEIFPQGSSVPLAYQPPRSACGLLVVWLKNP